MLKIKLKNTGGGSEPSPSHPTPTGAASPPAPSPSAGAPKLKLKLGSQSTASTPSNTQPAEEPRKKRPYNRKPKFDENGNPILPTPKGAPKAKKRQRDEEGSTSPEVSFKTKVPKIMQDNNGAGTATQRKAPGPKLTFKTSTKAVGGVPTIKMKHQGKPPYRPPGVGYDSEAEDAEVDPAIESQFILRMIPGEDCDILRKAIDERTIGKSQAQGGPGVYFRFLDREARRALVSIKGRLYAATMVDLPCVIESMKSWDKKNWVKAADVCQMLLVLGPVKNDDEARDFPLPREIDPSTHEYPHGLTPPMHNVRRRRFRPRASYRRIEEVERQVEDLLRQDREALSTEFELVDEEDLATGPSESEAEDEEIADADGVEEGDEEDAEGEEDDDEMARAMEAELLASGLFDEPEEMEDPPLTATSHDVAMHALGDSAPVSAETPGSASNAETESADDDDTEEEIDEDKLAAQQELQQQKEEIADLEKEIETARTQYNGTTNILFRQRTMQKIQSLQNDLNMKKAAIGEEVD